MKKSALNILIDASSLVVFVFMISTGLLLKFILPPGSGREEMLLESKGRGHQTIDLFMGLTRHEWGEIHFYISLIFLVFLIVHLTLHWNWISAMTFGSKQAPQSKTRKLITAAVIIFIITALLFPWINQTTTVSREDFIQRRDGNNKIR